VVINGAMTIDQRRNGSAFSSIGAEITLDRWFVFSTGTPKFSAQQSSDAPTGFKNSILLTVTGTAGSPAAGDQNGIGQKIEGNNSARFLFGSVNAKTVTVSFWVKSSIAGNYGVSIRNSDSSRSRVESYTINSANTWEYKNVTFVGCPTGTWLTTNGIGIDLQWDLGVGSTYQQSAGTWTSANQYGLSGGTKLTANSGATWQLSGVQLEAGAVATPFEFEDIQTTISKCQRYYAKSYNLTTAVNTNTLDGVYWVNTSTGASNFFTVPIIFPVQMRAAPTVTPISSAGTNDQWNYGRNGASGTVTTYGGNVSTTAARFYANVGASWVVVEAYGHWTASAEL
jgi:hypothetical protein